MDTQSALFGPSTLGSVSEMLKAKCISSANGMMALTTVIATVLGMGVGSWLANVTGACGRERWCLSAAALIDVATVGYVTSLLIVHLPAANWLSSSNFSCKGSTPRSMGGPRNRALFAWRLCWSTQRTRVAERTLSV